MKTRIDPDFLNDLNFRARRNDAPAMSYYAQREDALDEALRCTFPASDPIAVDCSLPGDRTRKLKARFIKAFLLDRQQG